LGKDLGTEREKRALGKEDRQYNKKLRQKRVQGEGMRSRSQKGQNL
jgi:hypothetical protein